MTLEAVSFFANKNDGQIDAFNNQDLLNPPRAVNFSITTRKISGWGMVFIKTVLFPWGLYCFARYLIQRAIMLPLYPAQNSLLKYFIKDFNLVNIDQCRKKLNWNRKNSYVVRHVTLENNGVKYSGLLMGKNENIFNDKWVLQASGNAEHIEHSIDWFARDYASKGFNVLMINGPGVGRSGGTATPETMGDSQEVGLRFLEEVVKANKIAIAGRSLGGALTSQAILNHQFKDGINYVAIRQMTFDRVSNIAGRILLGASWKRGRWLIKKLIRWAGLEISSTKASERLRDLNIPEIVVQCGSCDEDGYRFMTDGPIIAEASLGHSLMKQKRQNKFPQLTIYAGDWWHMDRETIRASLKHSFFTAIIESSSS